MNAQNGNLLVVDDNEMNRDVLSRRLTRRGHCVTLAEGGHRAIELVRSNSFDAVLLDIMMPDIDGLEVLRILREDYSISELPIIMVTAKSQSSDIVTALELGANDYVTKPLDFAVVLARLQSQIALRRLTQIKDQFLRIASHDLKNPLALILGAAATLPAILPVGAPMTEATHEILSRIHVRAREMKKIIEDFLDFQALEDGQIETSLETVDLNQVAQGMVEANEEYAAGKSIDLAFEPGEDLPGVSADAARVGQVVQNFVGNAIKFSPPDTCVVVRTRVEDGSAIFEVCDAGPGLTDEDLERAFGKYARLSNTPTGSEKSTGLGLYICKQLIDLHGGRIGVHNNSGPGATFWFSLPHAESDEVSAAAQ